MDIKEFASLGGKARAASLSPFKRSVIAALGGRAGRGKRKARKIEESQPATAEPGENREPFRSKLRPV